MKKIFFVVLAIVFANTTSFAQSKVPNAVSSAFNQRFTNATDIKWDKENAHEYEANFSYKGVMHSANFSDKGEWLETETVIAFEDLPIKVQKSFETSNKEAEIKAVAKIETSEEGIQYEIEVKKGLKNVECFYNAEGKLIK